MNSTKREMEEIEEIEDTSSKEPQLGTLGATALQPEAEPMSREQRRSIAIFRPNTRERSGVACDRIHVAELPPIERRYQRQLC